MKKRSSKIENLFFKSLFLKNYKLFSNENNIKLSKINLIFGHNSSGKSSILESFSLLKQSVQNPAAGTIASKGEYRIPTMREILTDGNLKNILSIGVSTDHFISIVKNFVWKNQKSDFDSLKVYDVTKNSKISDENLSLIIKFESLNEKIEDVALYGRLYRTIIAQIPTNINETGIMKRGKFEFIKKSYFTKGSGLFLFKEDANILRMLAFSLLTNLKHLTKEQNNNLLNDLYKKFNVPRAYIDLKDYGESLMLEYNLREKPKKFMFESEHKEGTIGTMIDPNSINKKDTEYLINCILKDEIEPIIDFFLEDYKKNSSIQCEGMFLSGAFRSNKTLLSFLTRWGERYSIIFSKEEPDSFKKGNFKFLFYDIVDILLMEDQSIAKNLSNYIPLSVERPKPEAIYIYSGTEPKDAGYLAQHVPDLLYNNKKLEANANKWIKKLGFNFKLDIKKIKSSELFEIRFYDETRKHSFSYKDVGTGISSLLPIIINTVLLKNKVLAIQEPERSMHPAFQLDLMDLFTETYNENNNIYLIETHSELLVLKLMQLVRDKKIKNTEVSINYVTKNLEGSKVTNLKLDEKGNFLDDWPQGFFDERIDIALR